MNTQIIDVMGTVDGITTYDGDVPEKVPEVEGSILPYFVLWSGLPDSPDEVTSDGNQVDDSFVWDFQITVVASNPPACRAAAHSLKMALMNMRVGTGTVRPNPDSYKRDVPLLDTTVSPARFMLPTFWRLITN